MAVCQDGQKLYKDYGLVTKGCVDLRFVAERCKIPEARLVIGATFLIIQDLYNL